MKAYSNFKFLFLSLVFLLVFANFGLAQAKHLKQTPLQCREYHFNSDTLKAIKPCSGKDTDRDGIDDAVDFCPNKVESKNGIFDLDGCPDPDSDSDQFADFEDACPKVAGGPPNGCPEHDKDNDGIRDSLDTCPNRAEDIDCDQDGDGCPEGQRLVLDDEVIQQIWQKRIKFKGHSKFSNNWEINKAELKQLLQHRVQDIQRISIQEFSRRSAKNLSKRRLKWLKKKLQHLKIPNFKIEILESQRIRSRAQQGLQITIYMVEKIDNTHARNNIEKPELETKKVETKKVEEDDDDNWDDAAF